MSHVRQGFEEEPDSGLVGKSVVRIFLRGYLAMKAFLGTSWILQLTFMTVGSILVSLVEAIFILVGPLVGGIWAVLVVTLNIAVYDTAVLTALYSNQDNQGLRKYYVRETFHSDHVTTPLVKIGIFSPILVVSGMVQLTIALT